MIIVSAAAMGVFVYDRVRVPARVYQRVREVDKKDLLPLHDEMTQVKHRIVHHSCLMDLAQRQHRQTTELVWGLQHFRAHAELHDQTRNRRRHRPAPEEPINLRHGDARKLREVLAVEKVLALQRSNCLRTCGVFEAYPCRERGITAGDRKVRSKDVAPCAGTDTEIARELPHRVAHPRERVLERRGDVDGSRREGKEVASASEAKLDGKRGAGYHDTIGAEHHGARRECDGRFLKSVMMGRK